jgi:CxxC motif-containing protein (DUF1111 family)
MFVRINSWRLALRTARIALLAAGLGSISLAANGTEPNGRELFTREWRPRDSRSKNGDGLGPMFNDTSCVGCHNQGGAGGGGSAAKNVQILSAFSNPVHEPPVLIEFIATLAFGGVPKPPRKPTQNREEKAKAERESLAKFHPGFRKANSLVLHRFSTDPDYAAFCRKLTGLDSSDLDQMRARALSERELGRRHSIDNFVFLLSERNTPPLFGSGKIDTIPDEEIMSAAEKRFPNFPEITGRVSRLKDGHIGRFGWKAQKSRLSDFVLTACAVELGLHVPSEPQSGIPSLPEYFAPGLDLGEQECSALIEFVASLPAPREHRAAKEEEEAYSSEGKKLFENVGCATCHRPQLGDVSGIYSDLLLHNMGHDLTDSGSYGTFVPSAIEDDSANQPVPALSSGIELPTDESKLLGATRNEWRTPPLWGVRDSAPYLHDGRAATLEEAIALHGGEATRSAREFYNLSIPDRLRVTLFLRTLTAPD